MKRKVIFLSLLATVLFILFFAASNCDVVKYRKESIKYLENKYNEKFELSSVPEDSYTEFGKFYSWTAHSEAQPDISFNVYCFPPGMNERGYHENPTFSDTYKKS